MKIGKPTHWAPSTKRLSACGLAGTFLSTSNIKDVNCLNCMKTKQFQNAKKYKPAKSNPSKHMIPTRKAGALNERK